MKNRWVRTLGVVLITTVLLAACGGAGAGDDSGAPDFSNVALVSVTGAGAGVLAEDAGPGPADPYLGVANMVNVFISLFGVFEDWSPDKSSSYDYGGITVTWSQTGDTWCWSLFGDGGETDFEFCITDSGSDYVLTVRTYGDLLLQGNLAYDGTTGDFTLYGEGPTAIYTYGWQPATMNPYDWRITAESLVADFETSIIILTTDSGDQGEYSGLQAGDSFGPVVWPG